MGAAGRDFHNFNVAFREDSSVRVIAFTATQIPYISGRRYPKELAGDRYPEGIPIFEERELGDLIGREDVDEVVFAYSDVSHVNVMHAASAALAGGADFRLMGPKSTMLEARVPVVAICATRTGSGKSQTTRRVARILEEAGKKIAVIRHPMPYGDLTRQIVQRFESSEDLIVAECTIEEREEYEPHIAEGRVVYAGIDYAAILARAEQDAEVLVWDGGNNDLPFFKPDVHIVVTDPLRAGNELHYHPGETNLRMADVIVINKVDSASQEQVERVMSSIVVANPDAIIVKAESAVPRKSKESAFSSLKTVPLLLTAT
jgi:predicted GTPase